MRVVGDIESRERRIKDIDGLMSVLARRDSLGGGIFFLAPDDGDYPCLCMRVSGDVADIHFYPEEGHCGFRCLGGEALPEGGLTTLLYEGCDPALGEETPNEFIMPFAVACRAAAEFLDTGRMPGCASWFNLG